MYYIKDLYQNEVYCCDTKEQLVETYRNLDYNFENLNITGNDIYRSTDPHTLEPVWYLRRYQVFDREFRSIDVREMNTSISVSIHKRDRYTYNNGHKRHYSRSHGAAFRRRDLKNIASISDNIDDEYEYTLPKMRNKAVISTMENWSHYEKKLTKYYGCNGTKSWKDQRRTKHQYEHNKADCYVIKYDKRFIPDDDAA